MTGTGESGWFLFCSFGSLSWSRGEDEACWGRATVNSIFTSRNTQTYHRERTRGRDSTKGGFARIGGRHKPPFRGNALKPQQSAFGKVHRVQCCSNRHLPLGESLLFAGSVCLCVLPNDVCAFQCWNLWKDFWRRWWGWVPPKALSPTAPRQLTGTRWLNLWFE